MIGSLKGILARKSPEGIVVETGGIGYEVVVSLPTLYELPDPGSRVHLIIHTHVRESQILLLGFLRNEEKEMFRYLTTVNGIGPRLAVNILSGLPADELLEAILQQDSQRLQKIPGVGKKMSERIVLELKDKIPPRPVTLGTKDAHYPSRNPFYSEVLSALMNLGYKRKVAEKALEETLKKDQDPEQRNLETLLKASLQQLINE